MNHEINIDSIRALEEQINEHEGAIIKLKRARNSLLNVSTLPPEVLGDIFHWNVTLKGNFDGLEEGSHNFLLVCHHWFEVASQTPELWSFWGNSLGDWEERCLRSAVGIPLDLVWNGLTHTFGSVSESQRMVLEDRAARDTIRRVHLQSFVHGLLTSIIAPLLSPSGGLRTNSLESLILRSEDRTPLDVSFFAHSHLSKLRCLKLAGCTISSWDHLTSQTTLLTTLNLSIDDEAPTPTMTQLLSILASNPHLQKLILNQHAIPDNNNDGESCLVPLRHLKELQLQGDTGQVFRLLRRLEHPNEMGMLSIDLFRCAITDIPQTIGPYLQDYLQRRGSSRNGLGLTLSTCDRITFIVGDAGRFHPSTLPSARTLPFVSITVKLNPGLPEDASEKLTLDLIAHTPREEIVYFRTHGSLEAVKDLRVHMPNLRALDLFRVPLLVAFPSLDQYGSRVPEIFPPSLQHLFFERPRLDAYGWIPPIAFLSHRMSSGNQLDSLRIHGPCHMCYELTRSVRDLVREFKIDDECLESWCPSGECM